MVSLESANLKAIIVGYRRALQWVTPGDWELGIESLEDYEFSQEATDQIIIDCQKFFSDNLETINQILNDSDASYDYESVGHDFFLTRERHGAGFWDRGFGNDGQILTEKCHEFGESSPYMGDNNLIYVS